MGAQCEDSAKTIWNTEKIELRNNTMWVQKTELQYAAYLGDEEMLSALLHIPSAKSILRTGRYRWAPLRDVAWKGHTNVMEILIDAGADVNAGSCITSADLDASQIAECWQLLPSTPLIAAVEGGHLNSVKLLIQQNADVNAPAFSICGAAGADVNAPNNGNGTALQDAIWEASQSSYVPMHHDVQIKLLLDCGADVNLDSESVEHYTALQVAAGMSTATPELIQLLMSYGGDVNVHATARSGRTALQAAIEGFEIGFDREPNIEVISLLLESRADVNAPPAEEYGITALQSAAINGHLKIAHMLLERGANPNAPGSQKRGRTVLKGAAEHGRLDMVQLLLNAGVVPIKSAIDFAQVEKHFVIANIMREELKNRVSGEVGKWKEVEHADFRGDIQEEDLGMLQDAEQSFFGGRLDDMEDLYSAD